MEQLTASESEAAQRHFAGGLENAGVRRGDRVAVIAHNRAAVISLALGALRRGIVPVMLNPLLVPQELAALIADADVALVVEEGRLQALAQGPPLELAPWPLARPMHYTSGTTGVPKGVWSGILDEEDARALIGEEREQWHFDHADVHLICSSLAHSAPLRFAMGTLLAGGTALVLDHFEAAVAADVITGHRPTTAFMVPAHFHRLFAHGLPSLDCFRLLAHAGAPCPENLKRRAIAAFPRGSVWEFYGATEAQFTACSTDDWLDHPGTVGRARPGRKLSIDSQGLVWCKQPSYARFEYWRAPEKTRQVWRDGAFTAGDLGEVDAAGYLYLSGRRDDLIISGGVNVYPAEVERVLGQMDGIEEVVVFPAADERWGQKVCAAICGDVTRAAVETFARAQLAPYKRPKEILIVDSIPLTGRGKVLRSKLAAMLGLEEGDGESPAGS
jgi:acyl-CoA synthetase (AMP-forming)/AMP-acid ligase II